MGDLTKLELDLIERFLLNRLSESETELFQEKLQDADFKRNVQLQKEIIDSVQDREKVRLKSLLVDEEEKITKEGTLLLMKKQRRAIWLGTAATILGFTILGYLISVYLSKPADLFTLWFEPYPNVVMQTERSSTIPPRVLVAFKAYEAANYEAALQGFEGIPENSQSAYLPFYKANSLMMLQRIEEAIPLLEQVLSNPENNFYQHALWYRALAYVYEKDYDGAIKDLEVLAAMPNSQFQGKAVELVKAIDQLRK